MKKNIILLACMVLGLSACYKSELEPLKGIFPAPTVVSGTSAATATSEKADGKRLFVVNLNEGGNQFRLNLVGDKYFLTANTYTPASEAAAKKGNFISGNTQVNGQPVQNGKITVAHTPIDEVNNTYKIDAVLFLADGTPYTLSWAGNLAFEPDPVVGDIVVENFLSEETAPTDAGTLKHTLTITNGDGAVAAVFEVYTPGDVTGIAGTYTCIEYAEANADGYVVGNGWSFPDWGIAGGSYIVADGARVDVAPGQIVQIAALSPTAYVFTIDGEDALVAGSVPGEGIVIPNTGSVVSSATDAGTTKHAVTILDEDGAEAAYFELYTPATATGFTGSFTCIEYAEANADGYVAGNGWSFPDWGIAGGSHYKAGGSSVDLAVGEIVSVMHLGANMFSFSVSSGFSILVKVQ